MIPMFDLISSIVKGCYFGKCDFFVGRCYHLIETEVQLLQTVKMIHTKKCKNYP